MALFHALALKWSQADSFDRLFLTVLYVFLAVGFTFGSLLLSMLVKEGVERLVKVIAVRLVKPGQHPWAERKFRAVTAADKRAVALLMRHLTPNQRETLRASGVINHKSKVTGIKYTLTANSLMAKVPIQRRKTGFRVFDDHVNDGKQKHQRWSGCVHTFWYQNGSHIHLPDADEVLAKLLYLRASEMQLLRTTNWGPR